MVSAQTRDFVQRRARELGYIPNPVASAFLHQVRMHGQEGYRGNLAFLMPVYVKRPYLTYLQEGAQSRAQELGYGLEIIRVDEYNASRLSHLLHSRGILGIIVGPLPRAVGHMTLDWSKFAVSTYGYSMIRPAVHRVVHHHSEGIRTIFRMCRRKGFRRIGLALRKEADMRSDRQWSSEFLGIQQILPKTERVCPLLASASHYSPEKVFHWINKEKPEVVIFHASECVADLIQFLKKKPAPITCVVLDRKPNDIFAGIDQQFASCGKLLVDSLSSQIFHNERGVPDMPIVSMVNGLWVDHPSLKVSLLAPARRRRLARKL